MFCGEGQLGWHIGGRRLEMVDKIINTRNRANRISALPEAKQENNKTIGAAARVPIS
jgi:hypothetical protein